MKRFILAVGTALVASLLTYIFYSNISVFIFKTTEPYFVCPVKSGSGKLVVRNDVFGDGEFGTKRSNGRSHSGIDIESPVGTPVYAARSGIVFCGNVPTGYGKYIMIYHPDGYQSFYGHLSGFSVYSTKKVSRGDIIGFVGKTGNASNRNMQPHLHFEIRKDGEPQDPRSLMR